MEPVVELDTLELLRALVTAADAGDDATALLHEDVALTRLDGVRLEGRAAVLDAIVTRGHEMRLSFTGARADWIEVRLEVAGLDGWFAIAMGGSSMCGRLVEIWMSTPAEREVTR